MIWFEEKKCDFWRVFYKEMQRNDDNLMKMKGLRRLKRQFTLLHQKTEYCWSHVRNDYQPIVRLWDPLSCRLREKSPADCRQIILHYLNKRGKGTKKSWNDEIIRQLFSLPKGFLDEGSDFHHILLDKCNSTPRQLLLNSGSTPGQLRVNFYKTSASKRPSVAPPHPPQ